MSEINCTFSSQEWTHAEMITDWADDGETSPELARDMADQQLAYMINEAPAWLPSGWTYDTKTGTFAGPYHTTKGKNPVDMILSFFQAAQDYVLEVADEIRAEWEADQAA